MPARRISWFALLGSLLVSVLFQPVRAQQPVALDAGLGTWHSIEQFEREARISVAVKRNGASLDGWAVLLGQHRKTDDRATLAMTFVNVTWTGQAFQFATMLPEDEGTIEWRLLVKSPSTALLSAVTVDGGPADPDLQWEMTR